MHIHTCIYVCIHSGASGEQLDDKLQKVVIVAKEYEKYRAISEMTIHDRLHDLQVRIGVCCSVLQCVVVCVAVCVAVCCSRRITIPHFRNDYP